MKKLICCAAAMLLCLTGFSFNPLEIKKEVKVEGKDATTICSNIMKWIETSTGASMGQEAKDSTDCILEYDGRMDYDYSRMGYGEFRGYVNFSITITCLDGMFEFLLDNVEHDNFGFSGVEYGRIGKIYSEMQLTGMWDDVRYRGRRSKKREKVAQDIVRKVTNYGNRMCALLEKAAADPNYDGDVLWDD